jgi:hypothetical protein
MWCGLCKKYKTRSCKQQAKNSMSSSCHEAMLDTNKISLKLLEESLHLASYPKTKLMFLMALLDSELRLRRKGLSLGSSAEYEMPMEASKKTLKVYLVSYPRDKEDLAAGIAFNKNNKPISVFIKKERFTEALDTRLINIWELMENRLLFIDKRKEKIKFVTKVIRRLGRHRMKRLLKLKNIEVGTTKAEGVARVLIQRM